MSSLTFFLSRRLQRIHRCKPIARSLLICPNRPLSWERRRHIVMEASCHDRYESFFRHTSWRWICNERARMAEHYVRFNVAELMRIAAMAVGKGQCVGIRKLTEGCFNKIFLLRMDDGYEVIVRIPTPIAGPSHYTTASEVATMDFLRTQMSIPVPKVFAWSSHADSNTVGAEYIVMEYVQGETLASRWPSLSKEELFDVIRQIVDIESRLFSARFSAFGSIYYKDDLKGEFYKHQPNEPIGEDALSDRFGIGPMLTRSIWEEQREQVVLNHGPWTDPEDDLASIGKQEAARTAKTGKPRHRQFFYCLSEEKISPTDHISLLSQYGIVGPYLIPKQQGLASPTLRHPDLHAENIILRPRSTQIVAIIDWQGASLLPFFLQLGVPAVCGDKSMLEQPLVPPKLPDNYEEMDPEEQRKALRTLKRDQAYRYYIATMGLKCKSHFRALRLRYLGLRQDLIKQASKPWDGDLINLRGASIEICSKWNDLVGEHPCPILFTDEEVETNQKESEEWNEAAEHLRIITDYLKIDPQGGIEPENFDLAVALNKEFRLQMLKATKDEEKEQCWRIWPFKDDDDVSKAPAIIETIV